MEWFRNILKFKKQVRNASKNNHVSHHQTPESLKKQKQKQNNGMQCFDSLSALQTFRRV